MFLCPMQELCIHFTNGTKRKVHHIRISEPCKKWLDYSCEKIWALSELQEYCTGQPVACNMEKVNAVKRRATEK